jgi:N-acetyl-gamma-glutamylphosphate reductase
MSATGGPSNKTKIGVLGASGYTGAELVRLLLGHPQSKIALLTAAPAKAWLMCSHNLRLLRCRH